MASSKLVRVAACILCLLVLTFRSSSFSESPIDHSLVVGENATLQVLNGGNLWSGTAIGVVLVILIVLFQGIRLLPTGRKYWLGIFLYSSAVGLGSFLLSYIPGLIRSVLTELGISQEMYNLLVIFVVAFIFLAGAWLGFWTVRKMVLKEDGSIDSSTSLFVLWTIRFVAPLMLSQSSSDQPLAAEP
ncbi:hypothetical protein ACLB2K_068293 [Fragaria x ananassa]